MLCLLLVALHWTTVSAALQPSTRAAIAAAVTRHEDGRRPSIYRCRSPNMEVFSCWWRPVEKQNNVSYTLLYSTGSERAPQECPDYVSAGPNSCFFDAKHTQVWKVYCMNVTAHTRAGPVTSHRYCLDVADIVEPDPPFNLTYTLLNDSTCGSSCSVLLSWMYPIAAEVHQGWITLVYELRYRNLLQPNTWKVKERLRERQVELFDLPVGSYECVVRCRSANSRHWSEWSEPINFTVSGRPVSDRMLVFIFMSTVAAMAFLIIGCGIIPQGKSRIKAFFLPPIPKPRILGLEPTLLKKGKMEEIDHHFSSFHGYTPPQYSMETWYTVSVDACVAPSGVQNKPEEALFSQYVTSVDALPPVPYCRTDPALCCEGPPSADPGPAQPELMSFTGMDYSVIVNSAPKQPLSHDFYTCVNGVTSSGALNLVPCRPETQLGKGYVQFRESLEEDAEKNSQLMALLEKQREAGPDGEASGAATPLLPPTD